MTGLRVALVGGAGFMGKAHSIAYSMAPVAEALAQPFHKQILVEASDDRARSAAADFGWSEYSSDWRTVVSRDDIDVVDIVTQAPLHAEVAFAAIEAGKHVFCEKPLTTDASVARELARAAQKAGVVTQVGFCYRHTPAVEYVRGLLADGTLGVPLQFRGSYLMDFAFGDSDWLVAPGAIGSHDDIGTHLIDMAQSLLGNITGVVGTVGHESLRLRDAGDVAPASGNVANPGPPVDDGATFLARFENGAVGSLSSHLLSSGCRNRISFELDASRGAVRFNWNRRDEVHISRRDHGGPAGFETIVMGPDEPDTWWPVEGMGSGYLECHVIQLRKFAESISKGSEATPSFADAARVQTVANAVVQSADDGLWVEISPSLP